MRIELNSAQFGRLATRPACLDAWMLGWWAWKDSNPHRPVRSRKSCPLNDRPRNAKAAHLGRLRNCFHSWWISLIEHDGRTRTGDCSRAEAVNLVSGLLSQQTPEPSIQLMYTVQKRKTHPSKALGGPC